MLFCYSRQVAERLPDDHPSADDEGRGEGSQRPALVLGNGFTYAHHLVDEESTAHRYVKSAIRRSRIW